MEEGNSGRYYLFGVPAGVADETLRKELIKWTGDPEAIRDVHWWKPEMIEDEGGIVQLDIDAQAAFKLKQNPEKLFIGEKRMAFVDQQEIPLMSSGTIDDDIIELVKEELAEDGAGRTWASIVGDLELTKFRNEEGFDCWRVQGPFSSLVRFEAEIRKALFKGADIGKGTPGNAWSSSGSRTASAHSTAGSEGREVEGGEVLRFTPGRRSSFSKPATYNKTVLTPSSIWPLRLEFSMGNLMMERDVDAIINPTNQKLEANANPFSKLISCAMGVENYEKMRYKLLSDIYDCIPLTYAMCSEGGNLNVKHVIHVAMPDVGRDKTLVIGPVGVCYASCIILAIKNDFKSVSFPPLGIEYGLNKDVAAAAAVSGVMETLSDGPLDAASKMSLIRFLFTDPDIMARFVESFSTAFSSEG